MRFPSYLGAITYDRIIIGLDFPGDEIECTPVV